MRLVIILSTSFWSCRPLKYKRRKNASRVNKSQFCGKSTFATLYCGSNSMTWKYHKRILLYRISHQNFREDFLEHAFFCAHVSINSSAALKIMVIIKKEQVKWGNFMLCLYKQSNKILKFRKISLNDNLVCFANSIHRTRISAYGRQNITLIAIHYI